jgi:hypothetical protein
MVLKRQIEVTTKYVAQGLDEQMKNLTRLQQSIHDTNKVASRLATGKGSAGAKELEGSSSFLSSNLTSFEKQNLSFLAQISFNTRDSVMSKKGSSEGSKSGLMERLFGFGEGKKIKGVARYKTDVFKPTGATSPTGIMTSLMGMMSIGLVKVVAILVSIASVIIASSRMLQRTLGNIMKFLMMIVRPIGDMIAVLLYPLMMVIRPLALMMNTIIRPFLMEARKSFRLSMQLGRQAGEAREAGLFGEATKLESLSADMFSTGILALGAGFGKLLINMLGGVIKVLVGSILDMMAPFVTAILSIFMGVEAATETVNNLVSAAKGFISLGIDSAVNMANQYFDDLLETISSKNEAVNTLAGFTGAWLDKLKEFPTDTELLSSIVLGMKGLFDAFDSAKLVGTKDAFDKAKTSMETLGTTVSTVIDGLITKYKIAEESSSFKTGGGGAGGKGGGGGADGEGTGSNWFAGIITAAGEWWNDVTVGTQSFSDNVGLIFNNWVLSIIEKFSIWAADMLSKVTELTTNLISLITVFTNNSGGIFEQYGNKLIQIAQRALAAAAQAEAAARAASAAAASAKSSAGSSSKSQGARATGGSIDQNGMYYLHRGETVVNPVNSSFSNTGGSSGGGGITINMNNSTFGNFSEWKREMDKYFSAQMRHMR